MALKQSKWGKGQKQAPVSREANGVVTERFDFTVTEDLEVGDIIELAVLPAYHFVTDAVLVVSGAAPGASVTADVGIMSGAVGEDDDTRTCGTEIFAAANVAATGVTRATATSAFLIERGNDHRSIGLKIGGADVTASGQVFTLVLSYAQ